jgi:hypothetical protein
MKGGVAVTGPKTNDEEREKEEKTKEYLVMTVVKMMTPSFLDTHRLRESSFFDADRLRCSRRVSIQ